MSNLTGTDKSVILLMTIGEDRAAEVFKHLSQREVQTLSAAMANVTQISNKQLTDVLAEFEQEAEQFAALNINANDYLRSVLVKALGEERAASLLEDILETRDTASGIETLNFMEPQRAADILRDDLANRGPVRLSQVENEQKAILLIVRRLAETGEMVIGSGEDTYV
ncbi:flagellar motor switch protein FliG [Escherichia coli]|uniref:FliG C-terminal domain-containing protein n=1 Tax=Escherichia coli TaxID=562 RepID=UPI000DF0E405|nr:FliG C-terminal domain-containing protein [Escherichia coli]RBV78573.1 flagellar motor switch protein FliG [Escherichia coli]